ncbi:MAG: SPFH domain-containing protein, partial [Candidatus Omnitrophota bacterium]|nr:SPFH domain-containing protein [Candidatus Omnitrophota bacterium]
MEWQNIPTPEEIIDIGKKKFFSSGKYILWIALGLIIIMGLKGVIYSIGPDEVGVIQRFGKYIGLSSPGLHVKAPFGIDRATPIKVEKIFKEEFGTRSLDRESRAVRSYGTDLEEPLMLTGDLNILDVRWIVQFKIKDPIKLLFVVRNP